MLPQVERRLAGFLGGIGRPPLLKSLVPYKRSSTLLKVPIKPMRTTLLIPGCFCAAALFVAAGSAAELHCPDTISAKETLVKAEQGWKESRSDLPIRFAGLTFFDGPPEQKASLVNDTESMVKGKRIAVWKFGPQSRIWISCSYSGSSIVLSRPLAKGTSKCTVMYIPKQTIAGLPAIEKIDCE